MKLKKIASLMLAGIMAVSMLAACGEGKGNSNSGSSSSSQTTNSGYSSTILNKTYKAKMLASAADNAKLTEAVKVVAETGVLSGKFNTLTSHVNTSAIAKLTAGIVTGATYNQDFKAPTGGKVDGDGLMPAKDVNYYCIYVVDKTVGDTKIDNQIADELDTLADQVDLSTAAKGSSYDYTVSVAKTDWHKGTDASKTDDKVVVGIMIQIDYTAPEL